MAFPRKPWTFADDAELKELAATGLSRIEIARRLNRSVAAIEVRASALGIRIPTSTARAPEGFSASRSQVGAPRLTKFVECLTYGKRTGRVAYVMDVIKMPSPVKGGEWSEDKQFNAADEILARPALKSTFASALRDGCAIETEK